MDDFVIPNIRPTRRARLAVVSEPITSMEGQADNWLASLARHSRNPVHLGYPARSVEQRANEGGITAGSPRPPTEMSEEDALSDRALAILERRHRSIHAEVIDLKYFKNAHMEELMRRFRVSKSQSYRLLKRAQSAFWRVRTSLPAAE